MNQDDHDMDWMNTLPENIRLFVDKLKPLPDFPYHLSKFAWALRQQSKSKDDIPRNLAIRAWAMAPDNPNVRNRSNWAIRKNVPMWHFAIAQDYARNVIYEKALRKYITPEMIVLEIGTGTGILAMLAARAGAKHVYTCEMEPLIAQAAQENIDKNGFSDRITIIAKKSTDLIMGDDLPEKADLLVSEIVDSGLLQENVLPVMADAHARLIKTGAMVLPSRISIRGALVGGPKWMSGCHMGDALGLDLSAFNRFQPPIHMLNGAGRSLDDALSSVVEIFQFDFKGKCQFHEDHRVCSIPVIQDGSADAFLQWIWLDFGDSLEYENKPPLKSCWSPQIHVFPRPIRVRAGDTFKMVAEHDCRAASIYPSYEHDV
ncbi:MAG: 50S ribosomal protein L11 methyltransferase [Proteobacteria bacterium]|nr:50S ribosomal protein L11 methyltransferase [Pseudomonadota bacterium]